MRGQIAGLIVASEEAEGVAMLRAELPVAGQTVVEQQVRLLAEAGLGHILVLAEQVTPALARAAEHLRRDGIGIDLARNVDEAAQRLSAPWVLVVSDGLVTDQSALDTLIAAGSAAILTVPNSAAFEPFELIDPQARWAGLLMLDLARFQATAGMLGDWDLQSTLLRTAVQAHATRVPLTAGDPPPLLQPVVDPASAGAAERGIVARAVRRFTGLADRYLLAPVARLAVPYAMHAMLDPRWFRLGSVAAIAIGAALILAGWPGIGLAALLVSGPVDALGRQLAALSGRGAREHRRWTRVREGAAVAALLALAWLVGWINVDWGPGAAALGTLGSLGAAASHRHWIGRPARRPLWFAETDNLIWLMLPFGLAGWWGLGLAAQAALAFASLIKLQQLTARA